MQYRGFVALLAAVGIAALSPLPAVAQDAGAADVPRTSWGAPDLQGVWDFRTITPLERPEELSDQDVLTDEQAAEREARAIEQKRPTGRRPPGARAATTASGSTRRASSTTPARRSSSIRRTGGCRRSSRACRTRSARWARTCRPSGRSATASGGAGVDGPEDRGIAERCILGFANGPPLLPGGYNQNVQVFQTPDHVVILNEMVHDPRIVPLDGRPHLPEDVRQWNGDARGYWEGETLVIESTNFSDLVPSYNPTVASAMGSGEHLRLIERLTARQRRTLCSTSTPWTIR